MAESLGLLRRAVSSASVGTGTVSQETGRAFRSVKEDVRAGALAELSLSPLGVEHRTSLGLGGADGRKVRDLVFFDDLLTLQGLAFVSSFLSVALVLILGWLIRPAGRYAGRPLGSLALWSTDALQLLRVSRLAALSCRRSL